MRTKEIASGLFVVISNDRSNLGGPMGSVLRGIRWIRFFNSLDVAKQFCEDEYYKLSKFKDILWQTQRTKIYSGDLHIVDYTIESLKITTQL